MLRTRSLLLLAGIIISALLFLMPKAVVNNEKDQVGVSGNQSQASDDHTDNINESTNTDSHAIIPPVTQKKINILTDLFKNNIGEEKSITFADSIADIYYSLGKLDSVVKYRGWAADNFPNEENIEFAGLSFYEAFGYAIDDNKAKLYGEKVREYLGVILKKHPERLDLKTKMAMTYISSQNPMQGIMMLREVVDEDAKNEEALYNLGLLSRQSGQLDKALERFNQIILINTDHVQARFMLGITLMDLGKNIEAKEQFEIVKRTNDDPAVLATVNSYLEKIN